METLRLLVLDRVPPTVLPASSPHQGIRAAAVHGAARGHPDLEREGQA